MKTVIFSLVIEYWTWLILRGKGENLGHKNQVHLSNIFKNSFGDSISMQDKVSAITVALLFANKILSIVLVNIQIAYKQNQISS